jgi:hypothetical protein
MINPTATDSPPARRPPRRRRARQRSEGQPCSTEAADLACLLLDISRAAAAAEGLLCRGARINQVMGRWWTGRLCSMADELDVLASLLTEGR